MKKVLKQPEFEGKLCQVGSGYFLSIPKAVVTMWEMKKGNRFKVKINNGVYMLLARNHNF